LTLESQVKALQAQAGAKKHRNHDTECMPMNVDQAKAIAKEMFRV
jgi:hypothetical protein